MNELWKRMVDFIKRMTESMSPPQIVGLVLLVLLLVGSLIWLVSWSGSDGLVLLVGAEEQMDIRAQIKQKLDERNVQYQVRDNGIYVHKNERDAIGMDLAGDGLFTDKDIFSWLFGNDFTSTSDVREKRNVISLQTRLERMFTSTDAIKSARVQITPGSEDRVIVSRGEDAKASVAVSLKAGKKLSEQNVLAMANILAGAVKGLKPENVQITDTSLRLYKVPSPGSEVWLANDRSEAQSKIEKEREGKIRDLLARTVGGEAYISFYVELDLRRIDDLKIERVNTLDVSDERSSKKDEGAGGAGGDPNLPE